MTTQTKKCLQNGFLVGTHFALPVDPAMYYANAHQPLMGCNRLMCQQCGQWLRHWSGYELVHGVWSLTDADFAHIFRIQEPEQSTYLKPSPEMRTYACQCWADSISGYINLYSGYDDFAHWRCGGHPEVS